jgi:hypothetical protein
MIDDDDFQPLPIKPYLKDLMETKIEKGSYTKGKWEKIKDTQIKLQNYH